jgi:hypothetical protein
MTRWLVVVALAATCLIANGEASAQPACGSPNLEPGLEGRDDLGLFGDLEYADWQTHFGNVGPVQNLDRVASPAFQGSNALRVRALNGEHYGADRDGEIGKFPGFGGTYGVAG